MPCRRPVLVSLALLFSASSLDNGLLRTPPLGFNSWTAFGTGVSEADLRATADFFVSSGLKDAGYLYVNCDDGWSLENRDASGRLVPDPVKFPSGLRNLSAYIHSKGLLFGIYSASSSVVCSGRPGSLFSESVDAESFVSWDIDYVKYDLCGEYAYGNQARYMAFADALNATGVPLVLSTEPYDIIPNPSASTFSNMWRCCEDIDEDYNTIVDRIDRNDVLAPLVGPGAFSDADMLQIHGNGVLTVAEQRMHFALWAITKNPLFLATDITRLSAAQLALVTNVGLIAINQDPLGVPARKLVIGGRAPLRHVGLVPCEAAANTAPRANVLGGSALLWDARPISAVNGTPAFQLHNRGVDRCLAIASYAGVSARPVLQPCDEADLTQAWALPAGAGHLGALLALGANGSALSPANSTIYAALNGYDSTPVPDAAYGLTSLGLVPHLPPAPCDSRGCEDYAPEQTWYWSERTGTIALALMTANHYHCFSGPCEQGTRKLPTYAAHCLAHVLSVAYEGTDPTQFSTSLADIWGGPLANGDFVVGLHNRASTAANVSVEFGAFGVPSGPLCVTDLWTNSSEMLSTSLSRMLDAHDVAPFRLSAAPCAAR